MGPTLQALVDLGGSGSLEEIREKIILNLEIPDALANAPHASKKGPESRSELEYNLAWARTYLKQLGFVVNSSRGVWSLTKKALEQGASIKIVFPKQSAGLSTETAGDWQENLTKILTDVLTPSAFERLIQRVLRETGFVQVEVTGRAGDGGIDVKGIAKINGILSFRVVFQCTRYKGSVGASEIRDFRGAMQGRADKGLFITTGYFTRDAIREATRDGAIAIDLVDGSKLAEKLKELGLGVQIETVESVKLLPDWFSTI